ncbi:hypothetical protein QQ045_017100 [Rhodiola kirilowii]
MDSDLRLGWEILEGKVMLLCWWWRGTMPEGRFCFPSVFCFLLVGLSFGAGGVASSGQTGVGGGWLACSGLSSWKDMSFLGVPGRRTGGYSGWTCFWGGGVWVALQKELLVK